MHLAALDLRMVEKFVDNRKQMFTAASNNLNGNIIGDKKAEKGKWRDLEGLDIISAKGLGREEELRPSEDRCYRGSYF